MRQRVGDKFGCRNPGVQTGGRPPQLKGGSSRRLPPLYVQCRSTDLGQPRPRSLSVPATEITRRVPSRMWLELSDAVSDGVEPTCVRFFVSSARLLFASDP